MSGAVEAGNKVLVNVGLVEFFGKQRSRWSRLLATVLKDERSAMIEPYLDWQAGDQLYFAPTAMQADHSDYLTIESYNRDTGELRLTEPFKHYHYGREDSTADQYNGVDTRGEVVLLSRNIQIVGEDRDGWGGTVLTADRLETDGAYRGGSLTFDNVEVRNCSQRDTYKAAIRFEGAIGGPSLIQDSVVHGSLAWSMLVSSSSNVEVIDSSFIGSRAVGVNLHSIRNVHLDGIFVADVQEREITSLDMAVDRRACVAFCSCWEPDPCFASSVTNSIAAGCVFGGFVAPGHDCGDTSSTKFKDNVAHSIDGSGAYIYPDPAADGHNECYEGSHFAAYKV